jgi:biopolymer transport protein ExbB
MKKTPVALLVLLVVTILAGTVPFAAHSQPAKPLTEETPAPAQPANAAAPPAAHVAPGGGFANWFSRGGPMMWAILACAIVGAIFVLERAITLVKARTNTRGLMTDVLNAVRRDGVDGGERVCEQTKGPIASIIHSGLRQAKRGPEAVEKAIEAAGAVEMSFLERGLIWLATVSTVAPLLGFLGTIGGLVDVFQAMAAADQVSAKLVAGGVVEALIPTQAGLLVGIPASIAHNLFLSMVDRFVVEMEESSSELVSAVAMAGVR